VLDQAHERHRVVADVGPVERREPLLEYWKWLEMSLLVGIKPAELQ
jgi:hypothetical protein